MFCVDGSTNVNLYKAVDEAKDIQTSMRRVVLKETTVNRMKKRK